MKARALRKRPGRKPKKASAPPRRPHCRDCRFRAPSGACLDPVLTSGRCGDYIRYVRGNKQYRRLYARPTDPRTLKQKRWRARFGDASSKYSQSLTDAQQDARIAEGANLRSRPRLGQSGPLTGQQYSIRREYAAHAEPRKQKTAQTAKVPQLQRFTRKYTSQVPQPQMVTRSTSGTHRGVSRMPPGHGRQDTGRGSTGGGRGKSQERRRRNEQPGAAVKQSQRVTRFTREHYQGGRRATRQQVGFISGTFPISRRASVIAKANISRPRAQRRSQTVGSGNIPASWACRNLLRPRTGALRTSRVRWYPSGLYLFFR